LNLPFGQVTHWSEDTKITRLTSNARPETVASWTLDGGATLLSLNVL
jgi:putative SOS response-associated peptidase YedK